MTSESVGVAIGRANQEIEEWRIDTLGFVPSGLNEVGVADDGRYYNLGQLNFYAESVNVTFDANTEINRQAGEIDIDQMYKQTEPLSCKIDIDFLISNNHYSGYGDPYLFLRDDIIGGNNTGYNFFPITVGANIYNKCYLDSFDITIKPFNPVKCRARFRSTNPPSGQALSGMYTAQKYQTTNNQLMDSDAFVFGHTCEISGWLNNITDYDAISQITFSRTYGRKDIYCLGDQVPRESLVKNVENVMVVDTTGLKYLIPSQGMRISGDIGVIMYDSSGNRVLTQPKKDGEFHHVDPGFYVHSGAYVLSENYSINGGDVVKSKITIAEAIL